ncbi:hypothetical protein B0H10DRAFT_1953701 [Mycena sp. CBHHK59/15]|nr:hypothetical protein B0H10DRAFT_1953701 [Mycena sp. CBHHK59/15]
MTPIRRLTCRTTTSHFANAPSCAEPGFHRAIPHISCRGSVVLGCRAASPAAKSQPDANRYMTEVIVRCPMAIGHAPLELVAELAQKLTAVKDLTDAALVPWLLHRSCPVNVAALRELSIQLKDVGNMHDLLPLLNAIGGSLKVFGIRLPSRCDFNEYRCFSEIMDAIPTLPNTHIEHIFISGFDRQDPSIGDYSKHFDGADFVKSLLLRLPAPQRLQRVTINESVEIIWHSVKEFPKLQWHNWRAVDIICCEWYQLKLSTFCQWGGPWAVAEQRQKFDMQLGLSVRPESYQEHGRLALYRYMEPSFKDATAPRRQGVSNPFIHHMQGSSRSRPFDPGSSRPQTTEKILFVRRFAIGTPDPTDSVRIVRNCRPVLTERISISRTAHCVLGPESYRDGVSFILGYLPPYLLIFIVHTPNAYLSQVGGKCRPTASAFIPLPIYSRSLATGNSVLVIARKGGPTFADLALMIRRLPIATLGLPIPWLGELGIAWLHLTSQERLDGPGYANGVLLFYSYPMNAGWLASWGSSTSSERAVIPALKTQIDAAIARTAGVTHYFWTGCSPHSGHESTLSSQGPRCSKALGRYDTRRYPFRYQYAYLGRARSRFSGYVDYASTAYANASRGVVYAFRAEQVRAENVFDTLEYPALVNNPAVTGIYQINVHLQDEDQPMFSGRLNRQPLLRPCFCILLHLSRNGLWNHQRTSTTTNYATWTRYGYFYGGQGSTVNPGAFTYSIEPQVVASRPTQATMATWIATNPSFDAQFPTATAWEPTSINYGHGWVPYVTACPYGADIGKMGGLRLRALPAGDSITYGFQSTTGMVIGITSNRLWNDARSRQRGPFWRRDRRNRRFPYARPVQNPNVIFLLAGTNDINNGDDVADAPDRLMAIVDEITSTLPNTALLVGTIPLNGDPTKEALADTFNYEIIQLLLRRASDGARVMPVPMESLGPEDMADSLHPNDQGYAKMADAWFSALWQAAEWGWIDPATGDLPGGNGKEYCSSNPVWYPQGSIANGAGLGTNGGLYDCSLVPEAPGECSCAFTEPNVPEEVFPVPASGQCSDLNDNSTAVRFADLNGDGRAEYLWLDTKGATTAFLNLGSSATGIDAGQIQWLPSGVIATGVGAARHQVQFADLNGDGRAEYLWVHDDGSVDAWLNLGGPDDGPDAAKVTWFPAGSIATGIGEDGAGVRFADLNGDGRAEYLWLDENGAMTAYLNLGSSQGGTGAANVGWLPQGVVATGPANGATRDNVILADVNGDGRADYLTVTHTGGVVELWINGGGPDDGPNAAKVVWHPQGVIATGVGTSGAGVQFADLNGDGRAEYLDVNYLSSAVNAWLNGCP